MWEDEGIALLCPGVLHIVLLLLFISLHWGISLVCELLHPFPVYSFASWFLVDWIVNSYVYGFGFLL